MEITINEKDGRLVATIVGDLDNAASPQAERSLSPLFDCKDRNIVIDCSDLNYISSSGLRIMLNIYKHARANGHDAILKAMNEEVEEVFSLSGFLQLFKKES
jgi:anti-sigma B factor antagonist